MSKGFFSFFPTIQYQNNIVTNILAKIRFDDSVSKNLAVFYPYTVKEGERPDQIASSFYQSPYYDWVIYLSNGITDPYHQWPLTQEAFTDFVQAKYGTLANSQAQIVFWRNNYYGDDTVLTLSSYNALGAAQRFYWAPVAGSDGITLGYARKPAEIVVETNVTQILAGAFTPPTAGTLLTQATSTAIVKAANTSMITVAHVQGPLANGACSAGTITNITTIATNFGPGVAPYFSPVTAFDHEEELNESRKQIRLLQPQYVQLVERDLKDLLSV